MMVGATQMLEAQFEEDLDALTAELIARQDQLVALLEVTNSTQGILDVHKMLEAGGGVVKGVISAELTHIILHKSSTHYQTDDPPARLLETQLGKQKNDWFDAELNLIASPLIVENTVCGVIALQNHIDGQFTYLHRKLLNAIAGQLSAQLDNIFLHEKIVRQTRTQTELDLARDVQSRLLPAYKPAVSTIDLYATMRPARAVGGDFYDYIETDEAFHFTVGDVSGKGMAAAMLMSMTRTLWHNLAKLRHQEKPHVLIHTLNDLVYDDFTDTRMLATLFSGKYHDHTLTYANAGHSPIIYKSWDGSAEMLMADGAPLGVLPTSFCETQTVRLEPHDLLIVATDGFPEDENGFGEMFGYDRLLDLINDNAHLSAQAISDTLFDALHTFSPDTDDQFDDQTLLIIKGTNSPA